MGTSLVVPIELVPLNLASGTVAQDYIRTTVGLDSNDYDGAPSWSVELVVQNADTVARNIYLKDEDGTVATFSIPGNQTVLTRINGGTITPGSGLKHYYISIDGTTSAAQLVLYAFRILITQTNATKTRIQIPMTDSNLWSGTDGTPDKQVTSIIAADTWQDNGHAVRWLKDMTKYADIAGGACWTFEASLKQGGGTYFQACAYDETAASPVSASIVSSAQSGVWQHLSIDLSDASFGVADGHEVSFKIKSDSSTSNLLGEARLYLRLSNLSKAEIYHRLAHMTTSAKTQLHLDCMRTLIDVSKYSSPTFYHEAVGSDTTNETNTTLRNATTNDSGTTSTDVTGSGLAFNGSAIRRRSGALSLSGANRYYILKSSTTGNAAINGAFLIIDVQGQASGAGFYNRNHQWDAEMRPMGGVLK